MLLCTPLLEGVNVKFLRARSHWVFDARCEVKTNFDGAQVAVAKRQCRRIAHYYCFFMKPRTIAAISSALVSSAKCPASST